MKKFLFAAILLVPAILFAQTGNWADYRDTAWNPLATDATEHTIATPGQLAQFAHLANAVTNFAGHTFTITATLDLSARYWTPAAADPAAPFAGTLTAVSGCFIDGITINASTLDYAALIAHNAGTLHALTLTNIHITARDYAAALAAVNTNGAIRTCAVHGAVSGAYRTGGVVGASLASSTISGCASHVSVVGISNTGGIVGYNLSSAISNCTVHAPTTGYGRTGGVVGDNYLSIIASCASYAPVDGAHSTGGIAGQNMTSTITDCTVRATVTGVDFTGGVAGESSFAAAIANCVVHASVISYGSSSGGIVGQNMYSAISGCMVLAPVSGSLNDTGGIAGGNYAAIIANCAVRAPITGTTFIGGVAGQNSGFLVNCAVCPPASVTGTTCTGGITGYGPYSPIANCFVLAPVTGTDVDAITGGITSISAASTITNTYWNPTVTGQASPVGCGDGILTGCAAFGAPPGTLIPLVIAGAETTDSLLGALNAYIAANPSVVDPATDGVIPLSLWTLDGSPHGYPILDDLLPPVLEIAPGADIKSADYRHPNIILPFGGAYRRSERTVLDSAGTVVYAPDRQPSRITSIRAAPDGSVALTHDASTAPAILGKAELTDTAWTYLNQHPGASAAPTTALIPPDAVHTNGMPFRFFTAR